MHLSLQDYLGQLHIHLTKKNPCPFCLLQLDTSVVSCVPAELKLESNGKKEKLKGFNVKLKDTILFPEGGGQVSFLSLISCLAGINMQCLNNPRIYIFNA